MNRFVSKLSIVGAAVACLASVPAQAQLIGPPDGTTASIPGLTGFVTTGADMTGLNVTATFSDGFSQSLAWGTTGVGAGGVFGDGWSLTLSGDSFGGNWMFDFTGPNSFAQLARLVLDGSTGLTVLDRANLSPGTDGSANGMDFNFAGGTCDGCTAALATYGGLTSIGAAAAVGDLFQKVTVDFGGTGPSTDWSFVQDTDNDSRFVPGIPEPETYALLLGGLGFVSWVARRRRQAV